MNKSEINCIVITVTVIAVNHIRFQLRFETFDLKLQKLPNIKRVTLKRGTAERRKRPHTLKRGTAEKTPYTKTRNEEERLGEEEDEEEKGQR